MHNNIDKELKEVITSLANGFTSELMSKTSDQLEEYWHFQFDSAKTLESNLYEFHDLLDHYSSFCRRWEEHHNGSCCVVERVRDKYIWPKIKQFIADMKTAEEAGRE